MSSAEYPQLKVEVANHTAVVTVNRAKALNALNVEVLYSLERVFKDLAMNKEVLGAIVTGDGDKAFIAGADIWAMQAMSQLEAKHFATFGHRVMDTIENFPHPVIAAVNGFALGGGCELALACDFIYAASEARLGLPEVNLGIFPGFGGTQRLVRAIGPQKAKELIFTARILSAEEAKEWGFVNLVCPLEDLIPTCQNTLQTIYSKGPVAIGMAKELVNAGANHTISEGLHLERNSFAAVFGTEDKTEGLAAFLEKRPAKFQGK